MTRHAVRTGPTITDDSAPVPPAHRPTRWTVRTVRGLGMVLLGLAVALSLLSTLVAYRVTQDAAAQARDSQQQAAAVERRLAALEEFVAGKGEQRDAETQRQNQQFNQFVCDVLNQLPAGTALDRIRGQYGCGPGLDPSAAAAPTSSRQPSVSQSRGTPGPATASPTAGWLSPQAPADSPPASATTPPSAPAPRDSPPSTTPPPPTGVDGLLCTALPIIC